MKPMEFDFSQFFTPLNNLISRNLKGVSINILGITFSFDYSKDDEKIAKEILVFLADKRVLNSKECCDNCIKDSIESILDIRKFLVQKQIELIGYETQPLFLIVEFLLETVRQFLTHSEKIKKSYAAAHSQKSDLIMHYGEKEAFFSALEIFRTHIHSCFVQIAKIAKINTPKIQFRLEAQNEWHTPIYKKLPKPNVDISA